MTRSLAIKIGSACITSSALLDPMRVALQAAALRRARAVHPELFGRETAAEVIQAIRDADVAYFDRYDTKEES